MVPMMEKAGFCVEAQCPPCPLPLPLSTTTTSPKAYWSRTISRRAFLLASSSCIESWMSASVRVMTWARSFLASSSSPRARSASARRRRAYTQDNNRNRYKAAFLILRAEPIRPTTSTSLRTSPPDVSVQHALSISLGVVLVCGLTLRLSGS